MPLDAITINAVVTELRPAVMGARIDKVQQPGRDTVMLTLRGPAGNCKLLIAVGTGTARVHLSTESYENPQQPPMFCMLLRKHLVGAKVVDITQENMERMLSFELDAFDEMGVACQRRLIVELMGRNANIILTEGDGHIIDCLRRVDGDMSRVRQVLPGLVYRLPPAQDRPSFFTATKGEREALFERADAEKLSDKWLLDSFSGLSPLVARELSFAAAGEVSKPLGFFAPSERAAFFDGMDALLARIAAHDYVPTMLLKDGEPTDYSFMPIGQYENALQTETYSTFSELLESFYTKREKAEQMRRKSQALYKNVRSAHERELRKLSARRDELLKSGERDLNRKRGDLLTANLYRIQKGESSVEVEDYFEPDCPKLKIKLDPLKTPQQNAAQYYKEYNKAKTAETYLHGLIDKGEKEEAYLASVMDEIERAESEKELAEIRRELEETGFLRVPRDRKREKLKETAPLRFVSSTGMEIQVGRNNAQNDKLTTKTARRTDVWFHAQKIHGSHVVVSANDGVPDERTIFEAATLAAYYSQGRAGGKLAIDYTQIRNVKKPTGAMPGFVNYVNYQTILVAPDEALVEKLKA